MSLRERLELSRKEKKQQEHTQVADEISSLESKRDELQALLDNLKSQYQASSEDLDDFKYKKQKISEIYDDYADELAEDGIEDKAALIKTATSEDVEVAEYKESGSKLRSGVSKIRKIKKDLKEKGLDLNFTASSDSGSPREDSIKVLEEKIAEINSQIESLKENNPEFVDVKKVAECVALMKEENFEYLAEKFIPRITSEFIINHSLIGRFKDKFTTPEIMAALAEIVSEILDRKNEKDENTKEALEKQSQAYLAYENKEKMIRDPEISDARQRVAIAEGNISLKESVYPDFLSVKLKYEDVLNEKVEIRRGFVVRDKTYPDEINFKTKSVDAQTETASLEISKKGLAKTEAELGALLREKPGFFAKKQHAQQVRELEEDIKKRKDFISQKEKEIEEIEKRRKALSQRLDDIGKILFQTKIYKKVMGDLNFKETTLEELFKSIQDVFDALKTDIDPSDIELVDRFKKANDEYIRADREFHDFIKSLKTKPS